MRELAAIARASGAPSAAVARANMHATASDAIVSRCTMLERKCLTLTFVWVSAAASYALLEGRSPMCAAVFTHNAQWVHRPSRLCILVRQRACVNI